MTAPIPSGGIRQPAAEPLRVGDPRSVGQYRIEGRLGAGGMGQVFLGTSAAGRKVAVKLIRPELAAADQFRARFAREVAAARRVGGFHTAQVVDADPEAESPWLVTAFVPGPTLQQVVAERGPFDVGAVLRLGAGIAEGLAAIHRCGLVHRDLKPGNVIVAEDGPRIIDFGIAHAPGADAMTRTGSVIGTYAYMSPEQIRAEEVSSASDVFAFGSVLAFAATGRSPFDATTVPAIVHRVASEPPRLDGLFGPLHDLVVACLAKDPAQRPSMEEVLARLSVTGPVGAPGVTFSALPTAPALPPAPPGTLDAAAVAAARPFPRRRALLLAGLGAAAAAVAVPAYLLQDSKSQAEQGRPRPVARLGGYSRSVGCVAFAPDSRTLAGAGSAANELWLWDIVTGRTIAKLGEETPQVHALAFTPDGGTLVGSCEDRTLRCWDVRSREPLPPLSGFDGRSSIAYSIAISPDGAVLGAAAGGTLQLLGMAGGRHLRTFEVGDVAVTDVVFSPDGKAVAVAAGKQVLLWEVDGGGQARTFTDDTVDDPFYKALISPDGKTIGGAGPGVRLWDRETGRPTATLKSPHRRIEEAAYQPGHAVIAGGGFGLGPDDNSEDKARAATGGTISLWDLRTGRITTTLTADLEKGFSAPLLSTLAFSPDGRNLAAAFGPSDTSIQLWKLA
ncbi:serine/threonine-protein kinase [Streptomyces sp. NPDC001034]|uniref:WD40 repeat domain-containing serine/threonine protein kinase n=1 Tax=Streptomyces sp. NPDC001034 TaxID=3154375 RepID=UPI003327F607